MSKQPRTIKQLNSRLSKDYTEIFPYGKHKNKLVADVVKNDPNYIVWWNAAVTAFPLHPKVVAIGEKNYRELPKGGHWKGCIGDWDSWGDEDVDCHYED